ncbi:hypothetical protein R5R35_011144 [Gryllus longicercus]
MTELFLKAFVARVADDFKQKELLPLKLLFFVHASTVFVLYPYLTIHMRELGINVKETAIMSAVTPVMAIVMPPLAGMVADRIGNFKILLATFSAAGGAVALLLLLVPAGRVKVEFPERAALELGCGPAGAAEAAAALAGADNSLELALRRADAAGVPCTRVAHARVAARAEACGLLCDAPPAVPLDAAALRSFSVAVRHPGANASTDAFDYTLHPDEHNKGEAHFRTAARALAGGRLLFLPAEGLVRVRCGGGAGCALGSSAGWPPAEAEAAAAAPPAAALFAANLSAAPSPPAAPDTLLPHNLTDDLGTPLPRRCRDLDAEAGVQLSAALPAAVPGDAPLQLFGCRARCLVSVERKALCAESSREEELDVDLTFWLYMSIRVLIGIVGGTAFAMFEGAVIAILREHSADYGLQRIYATVGGMISSPLSGLLIDWASRGKGYTDFRPAFYLYAGMKIASGLLILTINLDFKQPAKNVVFDVLTVLKNVELAALLVVVFVLGGAWGFIESFLFWMLQDLGGSRSLMGITFTVGGIAGIPLLVLSGPIIDRFGHANVLTVGFIFYAIRLLGYSLIYNPWLCLIFEAMESITSSLSFTAAVTYAAKLSTSTTDTSVQGLLGGLYYGVGRGAGSLIGGYMMTWIGTRPTYQVFAASCLVIGVIYFLTHKLYLRRRPDRTSNDIVKIKSTFLGEKFTKDRPGKPDKADKADKSEKGEKGDKADKGDKAEKTDKEGKGQTEAQPINVATPRSYCTDPPKEAKTEAEKNALNAARTEAAAASIAEAAGSYRVNLGFEGDDDDAHDKTA